MSDILLDVQSVPATPGAGQSVIYVDSVTKRLSVKKDTGAVESVINNNSSVASQSPVAATRTYIAGSAIAIPTNKLQVGTILRWKFNMVKTAAGIAASTIAICFGTLGTTGDTDRVSFVKPAGTAVVDEGWVEIEATVRSIGVAGVVTGVFRMIHNLSATGHMVIPSAVVTTISAGFDTTVANLIAGLTINTGAADAITIQLVHAEAINL